MRNDHSTENGSLSRVARSRGKKAGPSGMLLATGAVLIVVCLILYGFFSSPKGPGDKTLEAAQPPASGQTAEHEADAPQDSEQDGESEGGAAGNAGSPDASGAADADGTSDNAAIPAAEDTPPGDAAGNGGGDAGTATPSTPDKPVAGEPSTSGSGGSDTPSGENAANSGTKAPASAGHSVTKLPTSYVVQKGDTLSTISMKFYQSKQYVAFLAESNGIVFVNDMKVGDTIKIPALTADAGSNSGKPGDKDYSAVKLPVTYLVRPGDTLYRISVMFYQSGDYASFLAKHNKLDEEAGLKAGASLDIPAKPSGK